MKAKTRTNQPVEFENYDLPAGAKILGDVPMEQIKDADGHNRFIEGDIDLLDTVPEGVSKLYGKWTLSGSHLLVVLAFSITNTTVLNGKMCEINLPQWIKDKIVPLFSNSIDYKNINAWANSLSTQTVGFYFRKVSDKIDIYCNGVTASDDRSCRVSFDLLIDNEQGE